MGHVKNIVDFCRVQGARTCGNAAHFKGPGDAEIGKKRRCSSYAPHSDSLLAPVGHEIDHRIPAQRFAQTLRVDGHPRWDDQEDRFGKLLDPAV